jgi:predicted nucleic acid-binding protein
MPADVFFDTTILVYSLKSSDARSLKAEALLAEGGTISVQVLNELVAVARRELRMGWEEIEAALSYMRELCGEPVPTTAEVHSAAVQIAKRYGYHIYDSLMIAAAQDCGCTILYSEDMQHGQRIGSVTIRNPFLSLAY